MVSRIGARHGRWLVLLVIMGLLAAMLPWGAGIAQEATPFVPAEVSEPAAESQAITPSPDPTVSPTDPAVSPPDPTVTPEPTVAPSEPVQSQGMEAQSLETTGTITVTVEPGPEYPDGIPSGTDVCVLELAGGASTCSNTFSGQGDFAGLPLGDYRVSVALSTSDPFRQSFEEIVTLSADQPAASVYVNLSDLEPMGSIHVQVNAGEAFGHIPAGLQACATHQESGIIWCGNPTEEPVDSPLMTSFARLPLGTYIVNLTLDGYVPLEQVAMMDPGNLNPNVLFDLDTMEVGLPPTETEPPTLVPVNSGSISVTLLAGQPYGDTVGGGIPVCIELEQVPDDQPACQATTGVGSAETVTFGDLALGQYRITVSPPGYVEWVEIRTLTSEAPDASAEVYLWGISPAGTASLTQPIVPGDAFAGGVPAGSTACLTLTAPLTWGFACQATDGITAQTDYTWSNLPAGTYELRVTVPLRATTVIGGIELGEGEAVTRERFNLSGMTVATPAGQIDVTWYGNDGEWWTFVTLESLGSVQIDPASLPTLTIGTLRLSEDGTQLFFRPTPGQEGTHTFALQTVEYGEATVTVVFGDYLLPGYGHISVLVNDVPGTSIPAGYQACASSDALPDGPVCRTIPASEWPESSVMLTNLPYGTYRVTLTDGSATWTYPADQVVGENVWGFAHYFLTNLPPAPGTASLTVTVDPGAHAPTSGGVLLRLEPQGYVYPALSFDGIETATDFSWGRLPAGAYSVEIQVSPYQPLVRQVTLVDGENASLSIALDDLQEYPLETTFRVAGYGGEPGVWRFPFQHPALGAVEIGDFAPITVDGFGTLSRDPADPYTLRFEPAGPDIVATHAFEVPTVRGPGTVTIVMDTDYWWPGDAALVPIQLRMPIELDLVAAGTEVCLVDSEGGATCLAVPEQEYKGRFERYWDVTFFDVAPGAYDVAIRNVPGYGDSVIEDAVVVPPDLDPPVLELLLFGVESLEPEPEGADIEVTFEDGSVPEGAEVCLVNAETGEEICQPASGEAASALTGINALRQTSITTTLVFENVPPGIWRVIVRMSGFHDLEIGTLAVQDDGTVTTTDGSGQTVETIVVPPIDLGELEPTMAELTVISRFCEAPKSRATTCSTRLPKAEGTTASFTITGGDLEESLTATVKIGRQGKSSQGSATILLPTREAYTVCQVKVEGYTPSPSACVEISLDGDGAEVPVNNIKISG